jgi:hypothetical protein
MRKIAQICQILIFKKFKLSDFYDNFEVDSQEYSSKYSFFSRLSYLVCNQIWLNYLMDGCHFD